MSCRHRLSQLFKILWFTELKVVDSTNLSERRSLLTTKGVKLSSMCFSVKKKKTFFATLNVLSFNPEFKNKVTVQMTGYNLEEEEGREGGNFPPT